MALSNNDQNFTLVDKASEESVVMDKLEKCKIFAFDCESVKLNRDNKVSVINIALEDGSIYFIDVMLLGGISGRLKAILESKHIKKLMYDCRSDADSLLHQHNINLTGIIDMQLIQYVTQYPSRQPGRIIFSFSRSIETNIGTTKRQSYENVKLQDHSVWGQRPLGERMLKYISIEISCFFPIKVKLLEKNPIGLDKVESWSERYADSRRKKPIFDHKNPYHCNGLMPVNVVKKAKPGNIECTKCLVRLDASEFKAYDIRNSTQKCKVCEIHKPRYF